MTWALFQLRCNTDRDLQVLASSWLMQGISLLMPTCGIAAGHAYQPAAASLPLVDCETACAGRASMAMMKTQTPMSGACRRKARRLLLLLLLLPAKASLSR